MTGIYFITVPTPDFSPAILAMPLWALQFAGVVPGLRSSVTYIHGSHIQAARRDNSEWERDLRVDYVIPSGTFKGLGLTWRGAVWRGNDTADKDETRLIVSYSIPLL